MKPRKTIDVLFLKDELNRLLKDSVPDLKDYRYGIISSIETLLFSTGNYSGFKYLTERDMDNGFVPGIKPENENQFKGTDETRRYYF